MRKYVEDERKTQYLTNVWYMKCRKVGIVGVSKPPYHEMQYWAAQGYAVIFANPHGSSSNGNAFANLKGKFGGPDYDDLMSFVDAAIKQTDYIDPERLGVTGGSYGDPPPTRDHPLV